MFFPPPTSNRCFLMLFKDDNGSLGCALADRSWQREGYKQHRGGVNLPRILQSVKIYQRDSQVKGREEKGRKGRSGEKKSNKFSRQAGRHYVHLSPCTVPRIKGLYEWSPLPKERVGKPLATVDFLRQSIN